MNNMELKALTQACCSYDVEFQNVSYAVAQRKNLIQTKGKKQILKQVSGCFRNGQLTAIMGPSGAGKSSLLNALSGLETANIQGHIQMNRSHSCYITQENSLQNEFSLEELMNLCCDLQLSHLDKKNEIINQVLESFKLNHRRQTRIYSLSGGERKRLSIALELVSNPKIFFLDEPTSGLDEVSAMQCIRILKNLAQEGRTIVLTVHQPSESIFQIFDSVYVMAEGQCIYQGDPKAMLSYLKHIEQECPKYYSPVDYIIELSDMPNSDFNTTSSQIFQNGKITFLCETQGIYHFQNILNTNAESINSNNVMQKRQCNVSKYHQFQVLLRMMIIRTFRERMALGLQAFLYGMCSLYMGLFFYQFGTTSNYMFDLLKCLSAVITIIFNNQILCTILVFPPEIKIVKKEIFNHWYSLMPYYMAMTLSRMPVQFIFNSILLSMTYWMTNFSTDWWRFLLFFCIGHLISLISESLGLAIASIFNQKNSCILGPMLISPILGIGIYGFDFASQIPLIIRHLMKISFIRIGIIAWMQSIYGLGREKLECTMIYCHFRHPAKFLKFLEFHDDSLVTLMALLVLTLVLYRALNYWCLRKRCSW